MRRSGVMSAGETGRIVACGWGEAAAGATIGRGACGGVSWGWAPAAGAAAAGGGGGGGTEGFVDGGCSPARGGGGAYLGCFWWKKERMDDWVALAVGRLMAGEGSCVPN